MIMITRLPSGAILLQRDGADIVIDPAALPQTLGPIIHELTNAAQAIGAARRDGYESGLTVGYANGAREAEARIQKEAEQLTESMALITVNAPMAA